MEGPIPLPQVAHISTVGDGCQALRAGHTAYEGMEQCHHLLCVVSICGGDSSLDFIALVSEPRLRQRVCGVWPTTVVFGRQKSRYLTAHTLL